MNILENYKGSFVAVADTHMVQLTAKITDIKKAIILLIFIFYSPHSDKTSLDM